MATGGVQEPVHPDADHRAAPRRLRVGPPGDGRHRGRRRDRRRSRRSRSKRPIATADARLGRARSRSSILLCGALGAFTRNLVVEIEAQRAAAIDQATQMATANDLLVSLHALAQTLPASFDLGEVVESIRQRVRALFPYTALVVLVPDDAGAGWRAELAEGVRVAAAPRRTRAAAAAPPRQ